MMRQLSTAVLGRRGNLARLAALALVAWTSLTLLSCGGAGANPVQPPAPAAFQVSNVFVVCLENHSFSSVIGNPVMPYLNSLATQHGLATNYFGNTHPSIGNYFMMTTGQIITNDDNFNGTVADDNIVRQLVAAGKTWKGYFDDIPSVGYMGGDQYPYVKRHNPFAFFTDVINSPAQQQNIVPLTQLSQDTAVGQLPNFGFIIPDNLENGHDCPNGPSCPDDVILAAVDQWLKTNIDPLVSSAAFQKGGLLFIVFDESFDTDLANGGGHIAAVVVGPGVKPGFQSAVFYQHQNLLRTVLQELGVTAFPGASATASSMTDFLK